MIHESKNTPHHVNHNMINTAVFEFLKNEIIMIYINSIHENKITVTM
jgi:hypothetical protein